MKERASCQKCGKPASVFYKETINGKTKEMILCESCAEQDERMHAASAAPNFSDLYEDFFGGAPFFSDFFAKPASLNPAAVCPGCKTSLNEIRESGKFGCGECFSFFRDKIDLSPFMPSPYRGKRLAGKGARSEKSEAKKASKEQTLISLKKELKQAIAREDYEKAAVLRDKIRLSEE